MGLNIVAHGHQHLARIGNKDMVAIAACVTKDDWTPVSGLTKSDFKVRGATYGKRAHQHVDRIVFRSRGERPTARRLLRPLRQDNGQ